MAAVPPIVSATPPADVELSADANRSYVDKKSKFYVVTPGMHDRIKRLHVRLLVEGEELVVGGLSALQLKHHDPFIASISTPVILQVAPHCAL